ncbi:hypothetical protein [Frigoribacterium sp. CFBP 13707]|uniref:hypothetical protein n=1 Tax=Frigoribacterium sp. CFBP 13707 TaxID=2775313 RepID=UPI0017869ACA|nr:hypothetical protein [Frigoribacterium sp. CFBP 13707]MBD8728889.1 hypothetical protein [Frigoribacterium sp. CFBP 13707]
MTSNSAPSPLTAWTRDDYAPHVYYSGAYKLADSGVSPLVAAARGYLHLDAGEVADFASKNGLGNANSKLTSQVRAAAKRNGTLVLPWFRADVAVHDSGDGRRPAPTTLQLRPASPRENPKTGKLVKYENLTGSESVIDAHPSTPREWFTNARRVLITEGILKGDAALTALLRANGITDDQLHIARNQGGDAAYVALRELMLTVPEYNRVLILSFVGVANWKHNDVWVSLSLKNRTMLLAFDGDLTTNWNVWNQANQLWGYARNEGAEVALLNLNNIPAGPSDDLERLEQGKVGLDDFLTKHGNWDDVLATIETDLPDAPPRPQGDVKVGTWAVAEDGTTVQEFVAGREGLLGEESLNRWVLRSNIGGRVEAYVTRRPPMEEEVETGIFGRGYVKEDSPRVESVRIRLAWLDDDGDTVEATVTGPPEILENPPSEWSKKGADVPEDVLLHPEWPPRKGQDWLQAIKSNKTTPVRRETAWSSMGWVPVDGSPVCAFISGRTVLASTTAGAKATVPGVTEEMLPGASKFSLPPLRGAVLSEEWKAQVRSDLHDLYEHYITLGPWTDPNIAAAVLAAGLRPSVPVRSTTVLYVQGPPGGGKSWTVSHVLSFHQEKKTWTNKSLPGSMKDTATSTEQALAQSNVWVMDDLAPSADRRQSESEQAKLGDTIRNVHNKSSRRRSGSDLKAREVFTPRALLIVTAENEHTINSVRDRTVILDIGKESLNSPVIDGFDHFRDNSRVPGRIMHASVQAMQHLAVLNGWNAMMHQLEGLSHRFSETAKTVIDSGENPAKSPARHAQMAVDLMLGLAPIHILCEMVGYTPFLDLFNADNGTTLPERVATVLKEADASQANTTPARALLRAIRSDLAAGRAYIAGSYGLGDAPVPSAGTGVNVNANAQLGWFVDKNGEFVTRPGAVPIGHLIRRPKGDNLDVVMFNRTLAFETAQRHNSKLLPAGQEARSTWRNLKDEGLLHEHYANQGTKENRADFVYRLPGQGGQTRGVPVNLNVLLGDLTA